MKTIIAICSFLLGCWPAWAQENPGQGFAVVDPDLTGNRSEQACLLCGGHEDTVAAVYDHHLAASFDGVTGQVAFTDPRHQARGTRDSANGSGSESDSPVQYYQQWWTRGNYPSTEINSGWNAGWRITDLCYGNGLWGLVMSDATGFTSQHYHYGSGFPSSQIRDAWDAGRWITELNYGSGVWNLVTTGGTRYTSQSYASNASFPVSEIQSGWDAGRRITGLNYGSGYWLVVMSGGSGLTGQTYWTKGSFPSAEIQEGWNSGKYITSLTYGNGKWALVMSGGTKFVSQSYSATASFPETEISQGWDAGRNITLLSYGNGYWVLVMSKEYNQDIVESERSSITLYPNPARERVMLTGAEADMVVSIFDMTGGLVRNQQTGSGEVDLSGLPAGIYFLKVIRDGQPVCVRRLVKI